MRTVDRYLQENLIFFNNNKHFILEKNLKSLQINELFWAKEKIDDEKNLVLEYCKN